MTESELRALATRAYDAAASGSLAGARSARIAAIAAVIKEALSRENAEMETRVAKAWGDLGDCKRENAELERRLAGKEYKT